MPKHFQSTMLYLIMVLLFINCFCHLGLSPQNWNMPFSTYKCIADAGFEKITLGLYSLILLDQVGPISTVIKNAGMDADCFLPVCHNFNPVEVAQQISQKVDKNLKVMFWLNPFYTGQGECSWLGNPQQNCQLLKLYIKQFRQRGILVGVGQLKQFWQPVFGDQCKELGSEMLLWLSGNTNMNFNDFKAFGGWTKPTIKMALKSQDICGATWSYATYFQ